MYNKAEKSFQAIIHIIMIIISLSCVLPFILLIISSFASEKSIIQYGYSFFPRQFSLNAYRYLGLQANMLLRAYGITVFITVFGTAASLIISTMLAYPMSRKQMPLRRVISFFVFFTLLFNGGLVPTYLIYTSVFHIKNTIWSLIVPGLLTNGFYVLIMRTYFTNNIPEAIIESASIDGAGEFRIFYKIILPLSLPILATIGLFEAVGYWNDWFNGLIYLTNYKLFSIQNVLNRMLTDIQFLSSNNEVASQSSVIANMPTTTVKMAIAVVGAIPILIAYPFFQKYFVKGISIGAVKG